MNPLNSSLLEFPIFNSIYGFSSLSLFLSLSFFLFFLFSSLYLSFSHTIYTIATTFSPRYSILLVNNQNAINSSTHSSSLLI
ncbi:hypothetical protein QL285_069723 [Trifolium repens]|nr:hypothetical protein QL285_069723 [Trifolium repens]